MIPAMAMRIAVGEEGLQLLTGVYQHRQYLARSQQVTAQEAHCSQRFFSTIGVLCWGDFNNPNLHVSCCVGSIKDVEGDLQSQCCKISLDVKSSNHFAGLRKSEIEPAWTMSTEISTEAN